MYEGMFILPKSLNEDQLDDAMATVKSEIEKAGGEVKSVTRLGKRPFARPMKKQDSGYYFVVDFDLDGGAIKELLARYKLSDKVFRVQIVTKTCPVAEAVAAE